MTTVEHFEHRHSKVWRTVKYDLSKSTDLAKHLVRHPYTWPGGYPMFALTADDGALCANCCKSEYRQIAESTGHDGWSVSAICVNYEDTALYCDHCGELIESAYGVDLKVAASDFVDSY